MRRRGLLKIGVASTALVAAAGVGFSWVPPAWNASRLSADGRGLFEAVARVVLQGALPSDPQLQALALQTHLERIEETIRGLPRPLQDELALLLRILNSPPGRMALTGLAQPWQKASSTDVQAALQMLRLSSLDLRVQTYQALRDITYASFFADRSTWAALGYAGPVEL